MADGKRAFHVVDSEKGGCVVVVGVNEQMASVGLLMKPTAYLYTAPTTKRVTCDRKQAWM
jgi:hypothetical protein